MLHCIKNHIENSFCDFKELCLRRYKIFLFCLFFSVLGAVLGIVGALNVDDAITFLIDRSADIILIITNERNFFVHIFLRLLCLVGLAALMTVLSFYRFTACFNFIILTLFSYYSLFYITLYFSAIGISGIIAGIICLLPCFFAALFLFITLCACCFVRGCTLTAYGKSKSMCVRSFVIEHFRIYLILAIIAIIEGILLLITTSGASI